MFCKTKNSFRFLVQEMRILPILLNQCRFQSKCALTQTNFRNFYASTFSFFIANFLRKSKKGRQMEREKKKNQIIKNENKSSCDIKNTNSIVKK